MRQRSVATMSIAPTITGMPSIVGTYASGVAGIVDLSMETIADPASPTVTATLSTSTGGGFAAASDGGVTIGGTATAPRLTGSAAAITAYLDTPDRIN